MNIKLGNQGEHKNLFQAYVNSAKFPLLSIALGMEEDVLYKLARFCLAGDMGRLQGAEPPEVGGACTRAPWCSCPPTHGV